LIVKEVKIKLYAKINKHYHSKCEFQFITDLPPFMKFGRNTLEIIYTLWEGWKAHNYMNYMSLLQKAEVKDLFSL
jgi:hypothetical protein